MIPVPSGVRVWLPVAKAWQSVELQVFCDQYGAKLRGNVATILGLDMGATRHRTGWLGIVRFEPATDSASYVIKFA